MVSAPKASRYLDIAQDLVQQGKAYPCFCSSAEMREMPPAPTGAAEPYVYDGRCRRLTPKDQAALKKAGRKPAIRLIHSETASQDPHVPGWDFRIITSDQRPTHAFAAVVDAHTAKATHTLVDSGHAADLPTQDLLVATLDWDAQQTVVIPSWQGSATRTPITELRDAGYLPEALLQTMAQAGWDPQDDVDLPAMAARFRPADIHDQAQPLDAPSLLKANARLLAAIPEDRLFRAMMDYLTRRGHPIAEREPDWQRRFLLATRSSLQTLGDAEPFAVPLLAPTIDYDRDTARLLRRPTTHDIIDQFAALLPDEDEPTEELWRSILQEFRNQSASPGRAISMLRVVLTGHRTGPAMVPVLSLLGTERCRRRIEKARRYAQR